MLVNERGKVNTMNLLTYINPEDIIIAYIAVPGSIRTRDRGTGVEASLQSLSGPPAMIVRPLPLCSGSDEDTLSCRPFLQWRTLREDKKLDTLRSCTVQTPAVAYPER
jgi:hypothetical protein